jgi:hypothetical protein
VVTLKAQADMKDATPPAPVLAFIYDRQTSPTPGVLVIRLEACHLWARDRGWDVAGEWVEQGNGALYDDERPRFDAMAETMQEAAGAGWQPVCLVSDWHRLSRDSEVERSFRARIHTAGGYTATAAGEDDRAGSPRAVAAGQAVL